MKSSKTRKRINVKATIVKGDDGAHFRKSYQRETEVNVNNDQHVKKTVSDTNVLHDKKIATTTPLSDNEGGISNGVKLVTFDDGNHAYFKPKKGEPFVRESMSEQDRPNLNFESFHLNNKRTNEKLSITEHTDVQSGKIKNENDVTGQMVHREIITSDIAKALKMDHVPDVSLRNVDGEDGSIVNDLIDMHKNKDVSTITKHDMVYGKDVFGRIAQTDKKAGDKALFDFIIGNADRHAGNLLHKINKDGSTEMLAFDHGFTFPSSNSIHQMMDYHNQESFDNAMNNVPFTNEMIKNVNNFINSSDYNKTVNSIEQKIGKKEASAFKERIKLVKDRMIVDGAKNTKEIGYRKERFMT